MNTQTRSCWREKERQNERGWGIIFHSKLKKEFPPAQDGKRRGGKINTQNYNCYDDDDDDD
uniref:Uncharacterized protein n=1 Tax=Lepeophtheirus salmonis TaxID=72036 RepID=A0A0K2TQK7_LEPSM